MDDIDVNNYIEVNITPDINIKTEIEIKEEPLEEPEETLRYFQCNRCDYRTKRRYEVKNHIAANHLGMRFKCDQCDYEGKRKDKLKAHIKRIHEGVKTIKKPSTEIFPCGQCDYVSRQGDKCFVVVFIEDGARFTYKSTLEIDGRVNHILSMICLNMIRISLYLSS